jgi:hypothetical protein
MTRQPTPDIMADVLTNTPVKTLAPADIRTDGGTQPRAEISNDLVTEYMDAMSAGAQFPPVVIYFDGSDYWLADGFHRLRALASLGRPVLADVRQGTRRDAVLFSAGANATHGQRRTNADKRRAVLALLHDDEWQQWSDREIARRCAVHHDLVSTLRSDLSGGNRQIETRRVVRGGTEYDMAVPQRPSAPAQARQEPSHASQVDLQLAIGDWLDNFEDPGPILDELARDGQASILWEDLTASVPPCRAPDLIIAIAAFRQRMAATRKQLAKPDQPPPARQPATIVQQPNKDDKPAISRSYVSRMDRVWTFSVWLETIWPRCTPEEKRQTLRETAAQLETWADQMREEALDL